MTFINWVMLIGLAAIAIPILIHLLNRRHATPVDWGAMQFLLASMTTRKKHIMIEEIILMAVRCLLVSLLALAMARPFLHTRSTIPWLAVLPTGLAAMICLGIAGTMWSVPRLRWAMIWAGAILLAIASISSAVEYVRQNRQWSAAGGEKDVAIVIDGSTSMKFSHDGMTNFQRAIAEARAVINLCKPGDAVSIILAASVPRGVVPNPISDRAELSAALDQLQPAGGTMKVLEAMNLAAASLAEGHNIGKKIVLITDGQNAGWDLRNDGRWRFLAAGLETMTTPPQVVCRTLKLPEQFDNAGVCDITISRNVVGTDRPVRIDVKVTNTGTFTVSGAAARLSVDDLPVAREKLGEIPPNASETIRFSHQFKQKGMHTVEASVEHKDALSDDNTSQRVVNVIDTLPVLIVNGAPSDRPLDSAATFTEIALTPAGLEPGQAPLKADGDQPRYLVKPKVVEITNVPGLHGYRLIILANVAKLPKAVAAEVIRFVRDGGGLLIAPGDRVMLSGDDKSVRTFYSDWKTASGEWIVPAMLTKRRSTADKPARAAIKSFSHPALQLVADPNSSDIEAMMVSSYWQLAADEKDPAIRVAALLDTGDPLLVERKFGRGFVLMTAMSLDRRDSNLPSLKCFLPLVHELTYYLAGPMMMEPNVKSGAEVAVYLPPQQAKPGAAAPAGGKNPAMIDVTELEVTTPSRRVRTASCRLVDENLHIRFTGTEEPGSYRCGLPKSLADRFVAKATEPNIVPFTVLPDVGESSLNALTGADLDSVKKHVKLLRAETFEELSAAITGDIPGEELWKFLAIGVLLTLLGEVAMTRWISSRRKSHAIETVSFGDRIEDVQTFRARAKELLAVPGSGGPPRES